MAGPAAAKRSRQNLERALKVKAMGFTALKWDPFPGPWRNFIHREDEDHVVALRPPMRETLGPDFTLLVEVHRRLAPMHAIRIGRASPSSTSAGTRNPACATTSNSSPRSAARCPACRSSPARRSIRRRRSPRRWPRAPPTSSTPTSATAAASRAMLDIAAMAQPHAVAMAPHNYNSTLVGLAATVQLSAMIPNFWIAECFINLKPACDEIAIAPLTVQDSFVELPTTPGHGIDLDGEAARPPV